MQMLGKCSTTGRNPARCYHSWVVSLRSRRRRLCLLLLAAACLSATPAAAQNLTFSFFERYVDAVRQQAGIPGLAAAVIQDGRAEWARGFGQRTIEGNLQVRADTPFPVGALTQAFSSMLLLQCVENRIVGLEDPLRRWVPSSDPAVSIGEVLSHTGASGFRYDPVRYTQLTPVLDDCYGRPLASVLTTDILERLAMQRSVPGTDAASPTSEVRGAFTAPMIDRFGVVLSELATPYRLERGRPVVSSVTPSGVNASTGLVASVLDVGTFATAMLDNLLLSANVRAQAWTGRATGGARAPGGLGWFVQTYKGEPVVWQFGQITDAYSSLLLILPNRHLSFVLLANSDGLSAPFGLANGDVTVSPFAQLFLSTFLP